MELPNAAARIASSSPAPPRRSSCSFSSPRPPRAGPPAPDWLYRRLDFSGSLTSLPELQERIAWNARRPRPVFLLGDSVLGATALWEHRLEHPRRLTIPARLAPPAAAAGWSVQSLGADGLLLPDLEAIDRAIGGGACAPADRPQRPHVRGRVRRAGEGPLARVPAARATARAGGGSSGLGSGTAGRRARRPALRRRGPILRPRPYGVAAPAALVLPDAAGCVPATPRAGANRRGEGEHGSAGGRAPPQGRPVLPRPLGHLVPGVSRARGAARGGAQPGPGERWSC